LALAAISGREDTEGELDMRRLRMDVMVRDSSVATVNEVRPIHISIVFARVDANLQ
jgi:hypothetical protein